MRLDDAHIFDAESKTVSKIFKNSFKLSSLHNQVIQIADGQIIGLVEGSGRKVSMINYT